MEILLGIGGFALVLYLISSAGNAAENSKINKAHNKSKQEESDRLQEIIEKNNLNEQAATEFINRRKTRAESTQRSLEEALKAGQEWHAKLKTKELYAQYQHKKDPKVQAKKILSEYKEKKDSTFYFNNG